MPHALLVDDDANFVLGLAEVVGREGFTVKAVHSLKEARVELGTARLLLGDGVRRVMIGAGGPARLRAPCQAVEPGGDLVQAVVKFPVVRAGSGGILAFARARARPLISLSIHGLTGTGPRVARPYSPAGGLLGWAECEISCA